MNIQDLPDRLVKGEKVQLLKPSFYRLFELHTLMDNFGHQHRFLADIWKDTSIETVAYELSKSVKCFKDDEDYVFHIVNQKTRTLVGCVGIREPIKNIGFYEIWYWIGTGYMGRGYCTDAVILARNIVIEILKPNRLEICTASTNHGGNAVARKAGFQLEATMKNFCLDADRNLVSGNVYTYELD